MSARYFRASLQNIVTAAIGAFNRPFIPHIQKYTWMAKGAFAAIAGNFRAIYFNCLNSLHKPSHFFV